MRILTSHHVPFAIRSGGHMPSPLAANINNGVLIDMSMFDGVTYDAANNVATVGAGQKWSNLYNQLDPHNVTVVGGRVLDVGVGGLILGGESIGSHLTIKRLLNLQADCPISPTFMVWLATMSSILKYSPRLGLKHETLTQHQVVLADASVVNANEQSNSDLWWALKGGSNNFGKYGVVHNSQFA